MTERKLTTISIIVGAILIAVAIFYSIGVTDLPEDVDIINEVPFLGDLDSEHSHMSFIMMANDEVYDFSDDRYMERSSYVHFHHGDPINIHKHANGVTLPYFLETLGMRLTDDCLILDTGESFCEDSNNRLLMVVDGGIVSQPEMYELWHGDRILLYYGSDNVTNVRIYSQDVPEVPQDLMDDVFGVSRTRN